MLRLTFSFAKKIYFSYTSSSSSFSQTVEVFFTKVFLLQLISRNLILVTKIKLWTKSSLSKKETFRSYFMLPAHLVNIFKNCNSQGTFWENFFNFWVFYFCMNLIIETVNFQKFLQIFLITKLFRLTAFKF